MKLRTRGLIGLGTVYAALGIALALFQPLAPSRVVAYRHDAPGSATIVIAGPPSAGFALSGAAVPAAVDDSSIDSAVLSKAWSQPLPAERRFIRLTGAFRLTFVEDESTATAEQRHLVAFYPLGCTWLPATAVAAMQRAGLCDSAGFIEILRQSPAYLKANYDFDKPDGYSVAGRRSVRLPHAENEKHVEIIDSQAMPLLRVPRLVPEIAARIGDGPRELKQAARVIAFMNEQPVRVGPINEDHSATAEAVERLMAIRGGASAVQDQGFRDIWAALAVRLPGLDRVRAVSAYNYFPPFPDLVTYSHAVAEIYVHDEDRWILVDPWIGIALRHDGRFLGVADLPALRRDGSAEIEVVPLIDTIRRYSVGADGRAAISATPVGKRMPPMRSNFGNGRYHFGYLDYFASVTYGPEYRQRAPVAVGSIR